MRSPDEDGFADRERLRWEWFGAEMVGAGDSVVSLNVDVGQVQGFEGGVGPGQPSTLNISRTRRMRPRRRRVSWSSATSMFQDGRRTQILQTSDPLSDRRITIEVTTTVMK